MSPGVLKEILDTLAGTAESYRGLERGLECGFSQRYCHERLLDNDQTRQIICEFYAKWPKDVNIRIKFDKKYCYSYTRNEADPQTGSIVYFEGDEELRITYHQVQYKEKPSQ